MEAMQVLSAAEMQACDRVTTERYGVASIDLMRAAAAAVAAFAQDEFKQARRVTVLCGRGNNGGDGMMTAWLLAEAGLEVTTLLLGEPEGLKGDALEAWLELSNHPQGPPRGKIHVVTAAEELARLKSALDTDLIVDAVVGTGFKPPLKGLALEQGAGAFRRSAFRMGGGCDVFQHGCAGVSLRCGDYIYCSQGGACVWATDAAVGSAGGGCADRVAGGGDCFRAEAALDGFGDGDGADTARGRCEQGQVWTCAGGGRNVWIGGRQGGRAVDGGPGGIARGRGTGDGGGSCAGSGGGFRGCAGADDVAAGGKRFGLNFR